MAYEACCEIVYPFNNIHDHDIISVVQLWCVHLPSSCIQQCAVLYTGTFMCEISNVATPLIFNCGLAHENKLTQTYKMVLLVQPSSARAEQHREMKNGIQM